jgi:hypothetical protein
LPVSFSPDEKDYDDGTHTRAPKEQPWFWTITAREQPPSVYNHGYAASREQAMRYFKARAKLRMRYLITVSFIRLIDIINNSLVTHWAGVSMLSGVGGEIVAVIRNALMGATRFAPGRSGFFD